jgi:hypothetical protein
VLLGLTQLVGPANLVFRRRTPVSSYLRRDLGTWTVLFSAVHVIFGLQLHSVGGISGYLRYFVAPGGGELLTSFRLGNWTGLAATVIAVGLLAIFHRPLPARTQGQTVEEPATAELASWCSRQGTEVRSLTRCKI